MERSNPADNRSSRAADADDMVPAGLAHAGVEETAASMGPHRASARIVRITNASGVEVRFMSYGGVILQISTPDRRGNFANIVAGYDAPADYLHDTMYLGALIGRYANRIANGQFALGDRHFHLSRNDGRNHLHGGESGFNAREWNVTLFERTGVQGAELTLESPDGDQGYPGAVSATVTYALNDDNEFTVSYRAQCDEATPVNLTQHSYFNLSGNRESDILDHNLMVNASRYLPVDTGLIPTGELRSVAGTAFDFLHPRGIGELIFGPDEQLRTAGGYDHNFVVDESDGSKHLVARLHHSPTGRVMDIHSTEPGLQLYTGNHMHTGAPGARGRFKAFGAVALETQHFPDSPNRADFPSSILQPGQVYTSRTVYKFSTSSG